MIRVLLGVVTRLQEAFTAMTTPRFTGIITRHERPTAVIAMNSNRDIYCDDPDWLAELAAVAKEACASLMTARANEMHDIAQHINEETFGDPEAHRQHET